MTPSRLLSHKVSKNLLSISILFFALASLVELNANTSFGPTGIEAKLLPTSWLKKKDSFEVVRIAKDSPNHGKLKEGDVIIGIGNQKFTLDPRPAMAQAIDAAETEAAHGKLPLLLKDGRKVVLQLPVLGSYSRTAPFNCSKTDKIIEQAVASILRDEQRGSSPTRTDLLGLMATGEPAHLDEVARLIQEGDILNIDMAYVDDIITGAKIEKKRVTSGWGWGYNLIALGEYYLLTKDETVLPAIRAYAVGLARGQDAGGLWGHRMATEPLNGRLAGYAQRNQSSLSNFLAMLIARECGIEDAVLQEAIARTHAYVADHAGKGGFPYGVHGPQPTYFDNNGMSGLAAVCMSLQDEHKRAKYFSQTVSASHNELTRGHASSFFNPLWTPLGTGLSGPAVTHEFFERSLWYFNGKRHWEGGFPGRDKAGSFNGQALLMYCLPRKALLITGREADRSIWVSGEDAEAVVTRNEIVSNERSDDELIATLDNPFTQVSYAAAQMLTQRMRKAQQDKQPNTIMPKIVEIIKHGKTSARISAMISFQNKCPYNAIQPHAALLGSILRAPDEPIRVRIAAATALAKGNFKDEPLAYYNDVLKLAFEEHPNDPFKLMLVDIAEAAKEISAAPFEDGLVSDRALFYKTSNKFMEHKRQRVRGVGMGMLRGMPVSDFYKVADQLIYTLDNKDPSYHSYHNMLDIGLPGVETLASLRIKEGLDYLVDLVFRPGGKWGFKRRMIYATLPIYGAQAKPYIPKLEEHKNIPGSGKNLKKWQDLVKAIDENKGPDELFSLAEVIRMGKSN